MTDGSKTTITAAQATVLAAMASLVSAVLVAFVTGSFSKTTTEIERMRDQAVESIRQEGSTRTEEIRQLTAKVVEETKSEGSIKIEKFKLQRDLILDAIKTRDRQEAQKRLKFFASTGLIPDYASKVLEFTSSESINEIPILPPDRALTLKPLGRLYPDKAASIIELFKRETTGAVRRMKYMCSGFAIRGNALITPFHCVASIGDPSALSVNFVDKSGVQQATAVKQISRVESKGSQKISQEVAIIETAKSNLAFLSDLTIRKPKIGEEVLIIGAASSKDVGYRGIIVGDPTARFVADPCLVTEINDSEGYVGTNCTTSQGSSGSPIFAKDDGALLSLVAWGRNESETNGPLLYQFSSIRNLVGRR